MLWFEAASCLCDVVLLDLMKISLFNFLRVCFTLVRPEADMFGISAQVLVPGTTTTALLTQLLPDTDYNVGVVALYSDGEGPAVSDDGKTCKHLCHVKANSLMNI